MTSLDLFLAAIVLGAVQGLTEFLPVSSTAHLAIAPRLLGWSHPLLNSLAFDVALHLGTLAAVLAVFGREWLEIARALAAAPRRRGSLGLGLVLATLPALAAGALFEEAVSSHLRGSLPVATWLAAGAAALWLADRATGKGAAEGLSLARACLIGCAQALALLPGLSRSGATIAAGRIAGLSRREAVRYSFLLSAPVIAAACAWEARHLTSLPVKELPAVAAGVLVSGIAGAAAIRWLLRVVPRLGFTPFVIYRLLLAALIAGLAWQKG